MTEQEALLVSWLKENIKRCRDKAKQYESLETDNSTIEKVDDVFVGKFQMTTYLNRNFLLAKANAFEEVLFKINFGESFILGIDRTEDFGV